METFQWVREKRVAYWSVRAGNGRRDFQLSYESFPNGWPLRGWRPLAAPWFLPPRAAVDDKRQQERAPFCCAMLCLKSTSQQNIVSLEQRLLCTLRFRSHGDVSPASTDQECGSLQPSGNSSFPQGHGTHTAGQCSPRSLWFPSFSFSLSVLSFQKAFTLTFSVSETKQRHFLLLKFHFIQNVK